MKKTIIICIFAICIIFIVICNIIVVGASNGKCFNNIEDIPHSTYGILLGTGRSSEPSPYYDARIASAIKLIDEDKIDALIISGENQYTDYNEVDSMTADITQMAKRCIPIVKDYEGIDTYASIYNATNQFGTNQTYTVISQHFHNQRAVYIGLKLIDKSKLVAYNAKDTDNYFWRIRNVIREWGARVKAVLGNYKTTKSEINIYPILGLISNAHYGETHAFSLWNGQYWEVTSGEGDTIFEAMLVGQKANKDTYDSIYNSTLSYCVSSVVPHSDAHNNALVLDSTWKSYEEAHSMYIPNKPYYISIGYNQSTPSIHILIE